MSVPRVRWAMILAQAARSLFALTLAVGLLTLPVGVPADALQKMPPGNGQTLAQYHLSHEMTCSSCHGTGKVKAPVSDPTCTQCHGGRAAVIALTDNYYPDPHFSPHFKNLPCTSCHSAHKTSVVMCDQCHVNNVFIKQYDKP